MNKRKFGTAVGVVLMMFTGFWSCTEVDNTLGAGFIPDNQLMQAKYDTIFGIDAYQAHIDSFPTSNLTLGYFGSRKSDEFGMVKAGLVTEYAWTVFEDEKNKFGTAPIPDSVVFHIEMSAYGGDATVERTYNVYRLKERLDKSKTYYADFDVEPLIDRSDVFYSFDMTGAYTANFTLTGEKIEDFMYDLIDTTGGVYSNDSLFINKFKGIYIEQEGGPDQAAIIGINMESSGFQLHYRNHTDAAMAEVKDTLAVQYSFANHEDSPITSINTFKYDYTGSNVSNINDTLITDTPVDIVHVQGLGGVTAMLRFSPQFIQELQSKLVAPYTKMSINRAELTVPVADPTTANLDIAQSRLGMYVNYKLYEPIADYDYLAESTYQTELPYGGYKNRSRGDYRMDITSYVHSMLKAPAGKEFRVILGSAYSNADLYGYTQVALKTGPGNPGEKHPLKVILTYTLIK